MADKSRTLKLSILADVENLTKNLKSGSKDVGTFGDQISDFGKKAAVAFAAAGAALGAFAVTSIKNALADEAAQRKLEETLRASTAATNAQISAVGAWIDKTSLAIGVTDDELRPAFSRLARSTNDVEEAQKLLNLALDISAATGKPLEGVANALGKAYDGNATSLARLGLGLDANLLKSKDTDAIMQQLTQTFGNFAENEAETTAKKFERVKIAIDEAQESIGAALLPIVEQLANFLVVTLVPNMNLFIAALTGQNGIVDGIDQSGESAFQFGLKVRGMIEFLIRAKEEFAALGAIIATVFVVSKIVAFVQAIQTIIAALVVLRTTALGAAVATALATGGVSVGTAVAALAAIGATALVTKNLFDLAGGGTGAQSFPSGPNPIQSGSYLSGGSSFIPSFTGGAGGGGAGGAGGGGAGGGGSMAIPTGATDVKNLFDRLTNVQDKFSDLQFLVETGGISKSLGQAQLNALTKEFRVLERQAEALGAGSSSSSSFNPGSFRMGEAATTINLTVNGAIDSEGTARTVINALNDSYYRGTLGGGAVVGAFSRL
jgi:hypothetical protein